MVYCELCRSEHGWSQEPRVAQGRCEECGTAAVCYVRMESGMQTAKPVTRKPWALAYASHGLPYFFKGDAFRDAFFKLMASMGPVVNTTGDRLLEKIETSGFDPQSVLLTDEQSDALRAVYRAAVAVAEAAEEHGRKTGEDLIGGLTGAPKYSDADLRLLIAQVEVAKEKACEGADNVIAMLRDVLEDQP